MARISVLLPAPEGPRTSQREPGSMLMSSMRDSGLPSGRARRRPWVARFCAST